MTQDMIESITIKPGDVVVYRTDVVMTHQHASDLYSAIARAAGGDVRLLILRKDESLSVMREDDMAAAGWVRAERIALERMACAQVCDDEHAEWGNYDSSVEECAKLIRARGGE